MSTDLVQRPDETQHLDLATEIARLPDLVDAEDVDELGRVSLVAEMLRLHQVAMGSQAKVDELATLKVKAEAGIGVIDLRQTNGRRSDHLEIGGKISSTPTRARWRLLAHGQLQGLLEAAIRHVQDGPWQITAPNVASQLGVMGAGHWDIEPFRRAIQDSDLPQIEIARRANCHSGFISRLTNDESRRTLNYQTGLRLAAVLGMSDAQLRPRGRRRTTTTPADRRRVALRARKTRLWRERDEAMRAKGGKAAEMYSLARRAEPMATGARESLASSEARQLLDSAVLDLQSAAAKLHQAVLLG